MGLDPELLSRVAARPLAPAGAHGRRAYTAEKWPGPLVFLTVSPQPGPSPAAKCLVLALHSSGCLWLVGDLGQRAPLLSLLLGRAELCGEIRSGPTGLQALRRGYFTISRPKGGSVMICFSNCWFPSHGLLTSAHPPRASLPAPPAPGHAEPSTASQLWAGRSPQSPPSQTMATLLLPRPSQASPEGSRQAGFLAQAPDAAGKTSAKLPRKAGPRFLCRESQNGPRRSPGAMCPHVRLPASLQAASEQAPAPPAPTLFPWQRRGGPTYCSCSW